MRVQCTHSATIWASGSSRNPYFVVLWASLLFGSRFLCIGDLAFLDFHPVSPISTFLHTFPPHFHHIYPATPLQTPPPLQSPPPTRETVTSMFFQLTCIVLVCVSHLLCARPCIAFPLLQIKHLCVFCDILSPKALYGCVVLLLQTQDVFSR